MYIHPNEKHYYEKYYKGAVGLTIIGFKWDDEFPVLVCRAPNGEVGELAISQDSEGNEPGFLFGLAAPKK